MIITDTTKQTTTKQTISNTSVTLTKIPELIQAVEQHAIGETREYIGQCIGEYFGAISTKIAEKGDKTRSGGSYRYTNRISYVVKLKFKDGPDVDIIIVKCTIPYQLKDFDFDFCKIYFDGYMVHSLNWDSVVNKYSVDTETSMTLVAFVRYSDNIQRIEKYTKRGFIVTPDDTPEYIQELNKKETIINNNNNEYEIVPIAIP